LKLRASLEDGNGVVGTHGLEDLDPCSVEDVRSGHARERRVLDDEHRDVEIGDEITQAIAALRRRASCKHAAYLERNNPIDRNRVPATPRHQPPGLTHTWPSGRSI
jgi:hypothetical protein